MLKSGDKIIGWVHSHVRDVRCFFSSLDVHNQYLSQRLDANHLGLVVQICKNGNVGEHDYYRLTNAGMQTVSDCLNGSLHQKWNIDNTKPHDSCHGDHLYESWMHMVNAIASLPLEINISQQIQDLTSQRSLEHDQNQGIIVFHYCFFFISFYLENNCRHI